MHEELRFHIEARADDLMSRRGLPRDEALRLARIEFGAIDKYKDQGREARGLRYVDEIYNDLRYAIRQLRQSPVFTIVLQLQYSRSASERTRRCSLLSTP